MVYWFDLPINLSSSSSSSNASRDTTSDKYYQQHDNDQQHDGSPCWCHPQHHSPRPGTFRAPFHNSGFGRSQFLKLWNICWNLILFAASGIFMRCILWSTDTKCFEYCSNWCLDWLYSSIHLRNRVDSYRINGWKMLDPIQQSTICDADHHFIIFILILLQGLINKILQSISSYFIQHLHLYFITNFPN